MDHKKAESLFTDYYEGELSDEDRKALEEHLSVCDKCKKSWDAYRQALDGISGLHQLLPSDDFVTNVGKTIGRRSRGRFFGEQNNSFSVNFAVVSFVLILFFMLAYLYLAEGVGVVVQPTDETDTTAQETDATEE